MKVIIGAGNQNWEGWVPTNKEDLDLLDEDTWKTYFGEKKADALLCEHVFEHLTFEEAKAAAKIIKKYLVASGYIRVAVPDGNFPNEEYQNIVKIGGPGPLDHPAADHKIVYDFKSISEVFQSAAFKTRLLEYHDEEGNFRQLEWDISDGPIYRSSKIDPRNRNGEMKFPSLILDAFNDK